MRKRSWVAVLVAATLCLGFATPRIAAAQDPPGTITSKVLISGAPIHGANGLAVDQQGRLLVASVWGREIVALDPATGKILERIGPVVDGVEVGGPDDVAVAPDGSICWTDLGAGFVKCLRPDGSVDSQFVAVGVNPIAFNAEGRLFVALAFFGDKLYELDPDLVDPPKLLMSGSGVAPWPDSSTVSTSDRTGCSTRRARSEARSAGSTSTRRRRRFTRSPARLSRHPLSSARRGTCTPASR